MGLRFIFMLTRDDRTVEDAVDHLATALSLGVRHIGFKDVGAADCGLERSQCDDQGQGGDVLSGGGLA